MNTTLFSILMHRKSGLSIELTVSRGVVVEQNQTYLLSDHTLSDAALQAIAEDVKSLLVKHRIMIEDKNSN